MGLNYTSDMQAAILILIQVIIGFISGKLSFEVSLSRNKSIFIGLLSSFTFINIFSIVYVLKKSNEYIKDNYQVENENYNEFYENKYYNKANHQNQGYGELNKTRIFLRIMIGLNILLIVLIVSLFITVDNNSIRIDNLTSQIKEYSTGLSTLDDLLNGEEFMEVAEVNMEVIEETKVINNLDIIKDNF